MTHYYSPKQDSVLRITETKARLRGNELTFDTGSGVFSIGKVDRGSRLLVERCEVPETGDILDLGCGYGAVGIAVGKAFPELNLTFTDVNERAIFLLRNNLRKNEVKGKVIRGDGFAKVKGKYDVILLNPPQSAGKKLCLKLMAEAKEFLKKGGSLQAVMRHKIGGKDMSEKTKPVYGNCSVVSIKSGYRIYKFTV